MRRKKQKEQVESQECQKTKRCLSLSGRKNSKDENIGQKEQKEFFLWGQGRRQKEQKELFLSNIKSCRSVRDVTKIFQKLNTKYENYKKSFSKKQKLNNIIINSC